MIEKQETHSKMVNLRYTEVKAQDYLSIPGISASQAQNLFKWRVKMSKLGENFRGSRENIPCPLCGNHLDNQNMIFQCEVMKKEVNIKCKIEDIYQDTISLQTAINLEEIDQKRTQLMENIRN